MNNSGDAAEQVVRLSLEGTEVALKLTGSAAKNIAAAIYAVLKNKDKSKIKGRQRLTAMLKSGKELKVFTVSEEHLKQFATEAKRYGVVYCCLLYTSHKNVTYRRCGAIRAVSAYLLQFSCLNVSFCADFEYTNVSFRAKRIELSLDFVLNPWLCTCLFVIFML